MEDGTLRGRLPDRPGQAFMGRKPRSLGREKGFMQHGVLLCVTTFSGKLIPGLPEGPESGQKKSRSHCQGRVVLGERGSWLTQPLQPHHHLFSQNCLSKGWVVREIQDSLVPGACSA